MHAVNNLRSFIRDPGAPLGATEYLSLAANVATLALTAISSYAAFGRVGFGICTALASALNFALLSVETPTMDGFRRHLVGSNITCAIAQIALSAFSAAFFFKDCWLFIPFAVVALLPPLYVVIFN